MTPKVVQQHRGTLQNLCVSYIAEGTLWLQRWHTHTLRTLKNIFSDRMGVPNNHVHSWRAEGRWFKSPILEQLNALRKHIRLEGRWFHRWRKWWLHRHGIEVVQTAHRQNRSLATFAFAKHLKTPEQSLVLACKASQLFFAKAACICKKFIVLHIIDSFLAVILCSCEDTAHLFRKHHLIQV